MVVDGNGTMLCNCQYGIRTSCPRGVCVAVALSAVAIEENIVHPHLTRLEHIEIGTHGLPACEDKTNKSNEPAFQETLQARTVLWRTEQLFYGEQTAQTLTTCRVSSECAIENLYTDSHKDKVLGSTLAILQMLSNSHHARRNVTPRNCNDRNNVRRGRVISTEALNRMRRYMDEIPLL